MTVQRHRCRLASSAIELPSWAFGNSGTRFKVFGTPGTPRTRAGEDRGCRAGAPLHRPRADAWRCTSRGTRSTTTPRSASYAEDPASRSAPSTRNTFQDDDYKFGASPTPTRRSASKAIDHHLDCIDVMDATGSRDLKIWLADGTNYPGQGDIRGPPGPPGRGRCAEIYAQHRRRASASCSSTSSSSRRSTTPTSRTGAPPTPRCAALGDRALGLPRHRPPRARHEHRVHRRAAAAPRQARLVRLQLALLRRRRPDRRRGRPVPAVPHHRRGHPRRRARHRLATSRSCSTSATTSRRRSPARSARCSTCRR